MATYILPILVIAGVLGLSLVIGYLCLEFIVRLIGRGLGGEIAAINADRRPFYLERKV